MAQWPSREAYKQKNTRRFITVVMTAHG